jgi:hypothetical protein
MQLKQLVTKPPPPHARIFAVFGCRIYTTMNNELTELSMAQSGNEETAGWSLVLPVYSAVEVIRLWWKSDINFVVYRR